MDAKRLFNKVGFMYSHLYNQTATLKKVSGTDSRNKPITTDKVIKCRIEYENKLITGTSGAQVTSCAHLFTNEVITIGDIINTQNRDYTVIQSSPLTDFDGVTQGYEVYF